MTADIDPHAALNAYDIGTIKQLAPAGGTAGRTWKVDTSTGAYLLRLRGVRTSGPDRLQFDHGLRRHLLDHDVPTAATVPTTDGDLWQHLEAGVYELYPFVEGRAFEPQNLAEVAAAGAALCRYHNAAATYRPPFSHREPIGQYTALGFSDTVSDRMDDPHLQAGNIETTRTLATTAEQRQVVDRCLARVQSMCTTYAGPAYDNLAGWVIHGDYTPANLLFSPAGEVVGIFDLDWALPGARCRDVADGLYFFATQPRQIDAASIWSLTDAAQFDPERCTTFLQAYQSVAPLTPAELDAIPLAFAGRWLSIRLEGMAKVAPEDRFRFFSRDVETPLVWLDDNWPTLQRSVHPES